MLNIYARLKDFFTNLSLTCSAKQVKRKKPRSEPDLEKKRSLKNLNDSCHELLIARLGYSRLDLSLNFSYFSYCLYY